MTGILRLALAALTGILLVEARLASEAGHPATAVLLTAVAIAVAGAAVVGTIADDISTRRRLHRANRAASRWMRHAHAARDANDALLRSCKAWRHLAQTRGDALHAAGHDPGHDPHPGDGSWAATLDDIRRLRET